MTFETLLPLISDLTSYTTLLALLLYVFFDYNKFRKQTHAEHIIIIKENQILMQKLTDLLKELKNMMHNKAGR